MRPFICLMTFFTLISGSVSAAEPNKALKAAAAQGKYTYLMFFKAEDAATAKMTSLIEEQVSKMPQKTHWLKVSVDDRSAADVVAKFDASRLPMPAVVGVAPNGAVSGVFPLKVSPEQLNSAILTPRYSEMVKKLQEQKIAVVCLQPAGQKTIPAGIRQLEADLNLKDRVVRVTASAGDVQEARFFERMLVRTDIQQPAVLVFAPPGVFVGRYDANVSGAQLATAIHNSGRCNCKHCQEKNK